MIQPRYGDQTVFGLVTADNNDGTYDYLIDGQTYSGKPAVGQQVVGSKAPIAFLDRRGRRDPVGLASPLGNMSVFPTPTNTVQATAGPWGMLGRDLARDRYAMGPTSIPTLLSSGLPSDCTLLTLTGISTAIGCVSLGPGLVVVASQTSFAICTPTGGPTPWRQATTITPGNLIYQLLCNASTIFVVTHNT